MTLFEDDFGHIAHNPTSNLLTLTWSAKTASMEDEDFQTSNMALAVLADEHKATGALVDVRLFGHAFGDDLGRWRNRNILPIYGRAGLRKMAFLHGPVFGGPSEGGMPGETFATRHFTALENALDWLSTPD
jgi:hypothetical protein